MLDPNEFFPITHLSKEEIVTLLREQGVAIPSGSTVTEGYAKHIASKMADDYLEQLYWSSMKIILEDNLPEADDLTEAP